MENRMSHTVPAAQDGLKKPGSMVVHLDEAEMIRHLSDRARGRLFLALVDYAQDGLLPQDFRGPLAMCFDQMRRSVDRNVERYRETCERNRANANKRWNPPLPGAPACGGMPAHAPDANSNANPNRNPNPNINITVTPTVTPTAPAPAPVELQAAIDELRARKSELLRRFQAGDRDAANALAPVETQLRALMAQQRQT